MSLKEPISIEECAYYTQRTINSGKIKAWVFRETCPKCSKALMNKPKDKRTGKIKIRADKYVCPECNFSIDKTTYEDTLKCNIKYTCPNCHSEGELTVPFKRKKLIRIDETTGKKQSVDAIPFNCSNCQKRIEITKKLK